MLTLTLPAGAFTDQYGVPNARVHRHYIIDIVSEPYPTRWRSKPPAGSLIYDPSITGAHRLAGNTDTYTLPLAAGQTLSTRPDCRPEPDRPGHSRGPRWGPPSARATGASPGATVVLESAPIATDGTYSLIVGSAGGTSGNYTLQAILNAAFKPATGTNNSSARPTT